MKRYDKVNLFDLKKNDRFYFLKDKNKRIYQIAAEKKIFNSVKVKTDLQVHEKEIKKNEKVVFLRSSNDL